MTRRRKREASKKRKGEIQGNKQNKERQRKESRGAGWETKRMEEERRIKKKRKEGKSENQAEKKTEERKNGEK